MFRKLFLGLILVFMVGCASVPTSLVTKTDDPITSLTMLLQHLQANQGKDVRLGGVIASLRNEPQQTRIEMVALPLTSDGRPILNAKPQGRFIAYIPGFLEPMEYTKGRPLTVAGQLFGSELGTIGQYPYTFPVIKASGKQLWKIQQQLQIDDPFWFQRRCSSWKTNCLEEPFMLSNFGLHTRVVERVTR